MTGEEEWDGDSLFLDGEVSNDDAPVDSGSVRPGGLLGGKYRLEHCLRRGGMGQIYAATQLPIGRRVIVKVILPSSEGPEARRRFSLEAEACYRAASPYCVVLHDYDVTPKGEPYLVTEYLTGISLSDVLAISRPLEPRRAVAIAAQASTGLSAIHRAGFVHRDIKPGNLMVDRDADTDEEVVKIIDFGLVKRVGAGRPPADAEDLTRAEVRLGSPRYMAPEQIRGEPVGPTTDVYALGIVLFEMLMGRPPFDGYDEVEIMHQQLRGHPPRLKLGLEAAQLEKLLQPILSTCLEKQAERRYRSARSLRRALIRVLGQIAQEELPPPSVSEELVEDLQLEAAPPPSTSTLSDLSEDLVLPPIVPPPPSLSADEAIHAADASQMEVARATDPTEVSGPRLGILPPFGRAPPRFPPAHVSSQGAGFAVPDRARPTPALSASKPSTGPTSPSLIPAPTMPGMVRPTASRSRPKKPSASRPRRPPARSRRLPPDLRQPLVWFLGSLILLVTAAILYLRS